MRKADREINMLSATTEDGLFAGSVVFELNHAKRFEFREISVNFAIVSIHHFSEVTDAFRIFCDDHFDEFEVRGTHQLGNIVELLEIQNEANVLFDSLARFTGLSSP